MGEEGAGHKTWRSVFKLYYFCIMLCLGVFTGQALLHQSLPALLPALFAATRFTQRPFTFKAFNYASEHSRSQALPFGGQGRIASALSTCPALWRSASTLNVPPKPQFHTSVLGSVAGMAMETVVEDGLALSAPALSSEDWRAALERVVPCVAVLK